MSAAGMKTAAFTVRADIRQSARWKRAAEAEGFPSVGAWAALALDAYLELRLKAGVPVPLAWRRGSFGALMVGGWVVTVKGHVSPPFGAFPGTEEGPAEYAGKHRHTLVYLPDGRLLATLRSFKECKALAAELARAWIRWGGKEPPGKPAEDVIRGMR
jgi:hypothetical protein